ETPSAAGADVHLVYRRPEAVRPPPLSDVLCLGESLPHELPRGLIGAGECDFPVRRPAHTRWPTHHVHCVSPSPSLLPGIGPASRGAPPTPGGGRLDRPP